MSADVRRDRDDGGCADLVIVPVSSSDFDRRVYCLLGLPFDAVTVQGTVDVIALAARSDRRCFFSTPNLNIVVGCRSDARFRESILRSDLSLADGMPLVWIARMLRVPLRERVSGSSVFEALLRSKGPSISVYFFGGPDGVAAKASEVVNGADTGVRCVGFQSPGFGSIEQMSTDAVIGPINAARPDLLLVALGAKKGQAWILQNLDRLRSPVISYLGAVVNFVAGTVSRAPTRWQSTGLEWLWRIRQEPGLWRRYLTDGLLFLGLFVTRVIPAAIDLRINRPREEAAGVTTGTTDGRVTITIAGAWHEGNLQPLRSTFVSATGVALDIHVDLDAVTFLDSAFVGLLFVLYGHQLTAGHRLTLRANAPAVRRRLRYYCAEFLLGA